MIAKIMQAQCISCGQCAEICPSDAISVDLNNLGRIGYKNFIVDKKKCTGCGACFDCPMNAIRTELE